MSHISKSQNYGVVNCSGLRFVSDRGWRMVATEVKGTYCVADQNNRMTLIAFRYYKIPLDN